jgi:hypothetical protein
MFLNGVCSAVIDVGRGHVLRDGFDCVRRVAHGDAEARQL